jgi:HSP20 family protein
MATRNSNRTNESGSGREETKRSASGAQPETGKATGAGRSGASERNGPRGGERASGEAGGQRERRPVAGGAARGGERERNAESGGSARSGERERNLQTSREGGGTSPQTRTGSPAQQPRRGQIETRPQSGYPYGSAFGARNSPFAMMRRMMEDMDRLFSDYGFSQPGLLASSFFGPDAWSGMEGASGTPALGSSRSGGQRSLSSGEARGLQRGGGASMPELWAPQVEVFERGDDLVVRADLPGVSRDDVSVEVDDHALVIRGERHQEIEDEQEGYFRSERSYGSFHRVLPLPDDVDASDCRATFRDGVLEITLPRPERTTTRSRRIEIGG